MLRTLSFFLRSYCVSGTAVVLVVFVFLLCSSMLALTMLFSGSDNISDTLLSVVPLEFTYKRIHYFEQYYNPYKNNDLPVPEKIASVGSAARFRHPYLTEQKDDTEFAHNKGNITMEEQFLECFLSGLEELAQDPAVKYASYNLVYLLNVKNCAAEGLQPRKAFYISGINSMDFFAHNHISFVEVEEDDFSEDACYVSDSMQIRGENGQIRPLKIGDCIMIQSLDGVFTYQMYTVKGIFHNFLKYDYSFGADGTYLGPEPVSIYVSNASLRQIRPLEYLGVDVISELPYVHAIVFDIQSPDDYDRFYQKLSDFAEDMDTYTQEIGLWGTADLRVQTPTYLKMAGTITQTIRYYSFVMWIIDVMLLILSGSLVWYLLLGKRREMFLLHSLGMSKLRIALRYLAYFLLPVFLTALVGIAPGILLDRVLCTQIANDIFSAENALLSFSSSGNQIMDAARESIQAFAIKGSDVVQALIFTILVTAAVSGIIVFFGTLMQLRGNIRARIRSREL